MQIAADKNELNNIEQLILKLLAENEVISSLRLRGCDDRRVGRYTC